MSDQELNMLGNYFVDNDLLDDGWEFHQFVREYQLGYIQVEVKSNE